MAKISVRDRNKNKIGKKPNWEYRFEAAQVGGKRQHISKAGFTTKKAALEAGALALADYNRTGQQFEPTNVSVHDFFDVWVDQYCTTNLSYGTTTIYRQNISKHINPVLGKHKLKSLTPAVLQNYANTICKKGYSASFISSILTMLKTALDYAVFPLQYIRDNPMTHVKYQLNWGNSRKRSAITREDFEKIMGMFPAGNAYHIPFLLGWYCGLRISEALAITWDDVDFDNKTIDINKQLSERRGQKSFAFIQPKYGSRRLIKIGDILITALKEEKLRQDYNRQMYGASYTRYVPVVVKDEKGAPLTMITTAEEETDGDMSEVRFVCCRENGRLLYKRLVQLRAVKIRELLQKPFDFHTLRHSHATWLIEKGVTPKAVQQRLGHKNISTTLQIYVDTTENMQQAAVDEFEAIMAGAEMNGGNNDG